MDSNWDYIASQSGGGAMNKLPNEVKFWTRYCSSYLLSTSYVTVALFAEIGTRLLLPPVGNVKLKDLSYYTEESKFRFQDVFTKPTGVPWSAVELVFDSVLDHWKPCSEICEAYGTQVRSLDAIVRSKYNFVQALRFLPNLENLQILPSSINVSESGSSFTIQSFSGIRLSKLKHLSFLSFKLDSQVVELLEFIQKNTGALLASLRFKFIYQVSTDEFKKLVEIIHTANISKISLEIIYGQTMKDSLNAVEYKQSLGIHDLGIRLNLSRSDIDDGDTFYQLERFLANCSGLQTLRLLDFEANAGAPISTSKLLRFPTFHDLKTLKILFDWDFLVDDDHDYNADPEFQLANFNLIKSSDFPNLETVDLTISNLSLKSVAIDIRKIFDTSESRAFKSVKILDIGTGYYAVGADGTLATIFPNTIQMSVVIERRTQFQPILSGMKNLAELDLTLRSDSDNNELLFHGLGFIRGCKGLKKLIVRNDTKYDGKALEDTGLIELILLHPLNLAIYNVQIKETDFGVTQLHTVHPQVRFL